MKLNADEQRVDGRWELRDGHVLADAACERIEELITKQLERIATDAAGWDTLYRDPHDGRYWELVYLRTEMDGGGPPSLIQVEKKAVVEKYGLEPGR